MKILSLEKLKNLSFDDIINTKIMRFKWVAKDES